MSLTIYPEQAFSANGITNLTTQTPASDDLFAFVAVPTSRVVRITALGQGTLTKYLRVRGSAGGTILATGTVSAAATSATVINRGAGTAAQYAAQIVLWFAAGTNTTAIGSPTVTQDGDDVVVTFPTGTAYNTYVFETDDTQLLIAEYTETGVPSSILVSAAGTAAANGVYTYRGILNGRPFYNLTGQATDTGAYAICRPGVVWKILNVGGDSYYESADDVPTPDLVTTWTADVGTLPVIVTAIPAGTDAVLRKVPKAEMGVVCVLGSITIDLNTTDLQLSQVVVPTGKVCVVTGEIVRNASVDLTSLELRLTTGWNAGADNLWSSNPIYNFHQKQLTLLTTSNLTIGRSSLYPRDGEGDLATADNALLLVGTAGQTLGFKCDDVFGSAATVTVDVLGYFV